MFNQKGFTPTLIILGIVIVLGIIGAYYLGTKKDPIPQPQNQAQVPLATPQTSPNSSTELLDIPIYPSAKFDHTEDSPETTTYIYKTNETYEKVLKWYSPIDEAGNSNPATSGWVLTGGAGSEGNRFGNLEKGGIGYKMVITDTEIRIDVPQLNRSVESQILNDLGSGNTYKVIAISGNTASGVTSVSGWIAIKDNNQWKILWQGKNASESVECSILDKYKAPNAFSCSDNSK